MAERCFYKIDILEKDHDEIKTQMEAYLKYDVVRDGKAEQNAIDAYKDSFNKARSKEYIPAAYKGLIDGNDRLLIDLISEKVMDICGIKPSAEDIIKYLKSTLYFNSNAVSNATFSFPAPVTTVTSDNKKQKPEREITPAVMMETYYFSKDNANAVLKIQGKNAFVLQRGSKIAPTVKDYADADSGYHRGRYKHLISPSFEVTENITFETPSAAASFVSGGAKNGWGEWKTLTGRSLGDIARK
jgi:hypothetical protein